MAVEENQPLQLIEKDILNKTVIAIDFNWNRQGAKPKYAEKRKLICIQKSENGQLRLEKYNNTYFSRYDKKNTLLIFSVEKKCWRIVFDIFNIYLQEFIKKNAAIRNAKLPGPDQLAYEFSHFLVELQKNTSLSDFKKFENLEEIDKFYRKKTSYSRFKHIDRNHISETIDLNVPPNEIAEPIFTQAINQATNNNIKHGENEMPLYPDLTVPLREKLENFEMFREFSGGDELFEKVNAQLKKFQEGEVTVDISVMEQDIDNFINNIPLLAKAEIQNLACFIALIDDSFLSEEKKQSLNSKLIIKKNKLIRASAEESYSASDINYLSTLFSNKSSRFIQTIKEIVDKLEVEEQYQAFRQFLLEEFNKIGKDNTLAYANMRGFISYITYFYQSHASFKRLLQDVNFHVEQYEIINKIKLDSDKINLIKKQLDSLRWEILEKIENFNPQSNVAQNFWNEMSELFKEFYEKISELKEANRFALKGVLTNLKHKLAQVTKVPANTFASILVRQDSLIEEMDKLNEEIEAASDVEQFNKSYEQYLALKSDISSLSTLSSMKYSFDTFFIRNQQRLNKINSYQIKLQALKGNGSVSEEGRFKGRVLAFIKQKSEDIKATEKNNTDPLVLFEKIENLIQYVDKYSSQLAQHRNTALKSAFWGLFGIFRPETTSMKLVKDIKEELIQFNTSIREAPSCT